MLTAILLIIERNDPRTEQELADDVIADIRLCFDSGDVPGDIKRAVWIPADRIVGDFGEPPKRN